MCYSLSERAEIDVVNVISMLTSMQDYLKGPLERQQLG